jgi:hypothetical protein
MYTNELKKKKKTNEKKNKYLKNSSNNFFSSSSFSAAFVIKIREKVAQIVYCFQGNEKNQVVTQISWTQNEQFLSPLEKLKMKTKKANDYYLFTFFFFIWDGLSFYLVNFDNGYWLIAINNFYLHCCVISDFLNNCEM